MQEPSTKSPTEAVTVTAWERHPGTVVEIAIGQPLSVEGLEQLAHMLRATTRLILQLPIVRDV